MCNVMCNVWVVCNVITTIIECQRFKDIVHTSLYNMASGIQMLDTARWHSKCPNAIRRHLKNSNEINWYLSITSSMVCIIDMLSKPRKTQTSFAGFVACRWGLLRGMMGFHELSRNVTRPRGTLRGLWNVRGLLEFLNDYSGSPFVKRSADAKRGPSVKRSRYIRRRPDVNEMWEERHPHVNKSRTTKRSHDY